MSEIELFELFVKDMAGVGEAELGNGTRKRWNLIWEAILGVTREVTCCISWQNLSAHFLSSTSNRLCHHHSTKITFAKVPTCKVEFPD